MLPARSQGTAILPTSQVLGSPASGLNPLPLTIMTEGRRAGRVLAGKCSGPGAAPSWLPWCCVAFPQKPTQTHPKEQVILKPSQASVPQVPLSQVLFSHPYCPWHSSGYNNNLSTSQDSTRSSESFLHTKQGSCGSPVHFLV